VLRQAYQWLVNPVLGPKPLSALQGCW
jgi:hypothetical protein